MFDVKENGLKAAYLMLVKPNSTHSFFFLRNVMASANQYIISFEFLIRLALSLFTSSTYP
jgi:hypothetical protein